MPRPRFAAAILVIALASAATASANWSPGGILLSPSGRVPRMAADGSGGVLVSWTQSDEPAGLYVVRYDASGNVAPGWPANGVRVSSDAPAPEAMVGDGAGGAFVLWSVGTTADSMRLSIVRIDGSGDFPAGWTFGGRGVSNGPGQLTPRMLPGGGGSAVVVWRDRRASVGLGSAIVAQKVSAVGTNASGFSALGRVLVSRGIGVTDTYQYPELVADPAGGFWLTYATVPALTGATPISVTRLTTNVVRDANWPQPDLVVDDAAPYTVFTQTPVAPDGVGGAYVAVPFDDLRLHHVLATPTEDPSWPPGGKLVDGQVVAATGYNPGNDAFPQMIADGSGGVYLLWNSVAFLVQYPYLVLQRIRSDGQPAPGWDVPRPFTGTWHATLVARPGGIYGSGERVWQCAQLNCQYDGLINCRRDDATQDPAWVLSEPWPYPFSDGPGLDLAYGSVNSGGAVLAPDGTNGVFAAFRVDAFDPIMPGLRLQHFVPAGLVTSVAPRTSARLALRVVRAEGSRIRASLETHAAGRVEIEVFDVAGRRLGRNVLDAPSGFTGEVAVPCATHASALVFVRARQGAATTTARAAMLR